MRNLTSTELKLAATSAASKPSSTVSLGAGTMYGVHDTFRHGHASVRSQVIAGHPMEPIVQQQAAADFQLKLSLAKRTYGTHMPIRLQMERAILSQPKRIPVLKSSNFGMDILSGKMDDIGFEDILGEPYLSVDKLDVHTSMEQRLKINV